MHMPIPAFKLKRDLPILIGILVLLGLIYLFFSYSDLIYTLASFQQVDDSSIYVMTYHGDDQIFQKYTELLKTYPQQIDDFTTFAENSTLISHNFFAHTPTNDPLVALNLYDYHTGPTLFLLNKPDHGYQSISLVNLAYIGIDQPDKLTLLQRRQLLLASATPLAGINEQGLIITCAAVNSSELPYQQDRQNLTGFAAIRLILDQASSTEEAIQLLKSYNLRFTPWPHLHYLITDATGASTIVEFIDEQVVTTGGEDFLVMTNLYADAKKDAHWQHTFLTQELKNKQGVVTPQQALEMLEIASEPQNLRWSAIFDGASREVRLALDGDFGYFHQFALESQ